MKFKATILEKNFTSEIDLSGIVRISGSTPLQIVTSNNVFYIDNKMTFFHENEDTILIEGIICDASHLYGRCLIELSNE